MAQQCLLLQEQITHQVNQIQQQSIQKNLHSDLKWQKATRAFLVKTKFTKLALFQTVSSLQSL